MKNRLIFPVFTVLWMLMIFYFSSRTAVDSSTQSMFITERIIRFFVSNPSENLLFLAEVFVRKAAHFTEYFILGGLVFGSFKSGFKLKNINKIFTYTFFICLLYAAGDEIHQYFVPGRACRLFDVFVDALGISSFILVSFLYSKYKKIC